MFRILILIVFLGVLYCLGSGLFFLVHNNCDAKKLAKALTWRISLSLLLFGFMMLAYWLGWLHPHGLTKGP